MQQPKSLTIPPRNLKTQAQHRREVFWQITVPFMLFLLILLGLVGLVIWSGIQAQPEVSRWADISLVWLILPWIIVSLIFMLLIAAIAYGVIMLIHILPGYTRKVQDFFLRIQVKVAGFTDRLVAPIIEAEVKAAGAKRLRDRLTGKGR